jgi:hypothetical protein
MTLGIIRDSAIAPAPRDDLGLIAQLIADGLCMLLQSNPVPQLTLGGGIGYAGIQNSVIVAADGYYNDPFFGETNDPNGNHIEIALDGNILTPQNAIPAFNMTGTTGTDNLIYVWVDYDAPTQNMSVFTRQNNSTKPATALMSRTFDIKDYLVELFQPPI